MAHIAGNKTVNGLTGLFRPGGFSPFSLKDVSFGGVGRGSAWNIDLDFEGKEAVINPVIEFKIRMREQEILKSYHSVT